MHQGFSGEAKRAVEVLYIPLKHKIIRIDGFAPPRESGASQGEVRGRYSSFLIRKNRYLVTLARVLPRRNKRSRAHTSIFTIENQHFLVSCIRERRQKKYEIIQFLLFFFSISALLHQCTKAWIIRKPFISYSFFSVFLLPCIRARRQKKYESHSFPIFFSISASGPGILGFRHWA